MIRQKRSVSESGEISGETLEQYQQNNNFFPTKVPSNLTFAMENAIIGHFPSKVFSFNYFGDFATLLTTCIVVK